MFEQVFKNVDDLLWKEAVPGSAGLRTGAVVVESTLRPNVRTGETAYLFLEHFIKMRKAGGRAGIVIKNIFLSNTDNASVLDEALNGRL